MMKGGRLRCPAFKHVDNHIEVTDHIDSHDQVNKVSRELGSALANYLLLSSLIAATECTPDLGLSSLSGSELCCVKEIGKAKPVPRQYQDLQDGKVPYIFI